MSATPSRTPDRQPPIADRRGDEASLAEALSAVALTEQAAGMTRSDAIDRALELEPATLGLCIMRQPSFAFGSILGSEDRLERARDVFTDLMRRADEHGNVTSIAPIRNRLSTTWCLLGDLDSGRAAGTRVGGVRAPERPAPEPRLGAGSAGPGPRAAR